MVHRFMTLGTGLMIALFALVAWGQPWAAESTVDTWPNMWLGMNAWGCLGGGYNPCDPGDYIMGCEMPPGSNTQYLGLAALWIGAVIDDGETFTPRVSVGTDGWLNPGVNEIWGISDPIIERSFLDTVNCLGENIYDPAALSHHEFEMTLYDTLTDEFYVIRDYDGTPHRPLGLKIIRTVYSTYVLPCSYTYWIRYRIVNIGNYRLRNLHLGHFLESGVGQRSRVEYPWGNPPADGSDDIAGFEPTRRIAYIADNDARDYEYGDLWTCPHIAGLMHLLPAGSPQHESFNWWVSNGLPARDYGPSWEDAVEWTATYGTPMGDARKFELMGNGEMDFDQVRVNDPEWLAAHPQGEHAWRMPDFPGLNHLADGYDVRALFSVGPFGEDMGSYTVLMPSDSVDVWMAIVGGRNFHDSRFPQPPGGPINPELFNWDDLFYHADIVRDNLCVPWLDAETPRFVHVPTRFALDPLWPNPFNARANIRFHVDRAGEVTVRAYNILGRTATEIARERFGIGTHTLSWDAGGLPSGLYFIEARTSHGERAVQKAALVR